MLIVSVDMVSLAFAQVSVILEKKSVSVKKVSNGRDRRVSLCAVAQCVRYRMVRQLTMESHGPFVSVSATPPSSLSVSLRHFVTLSRSELIHPDIVTAKRPTQPRSHFILIPPTFTITTTTTSHPNNSVALALQHSHSSHYGHHHHLPTLHLSYLLIPALYPGSTPSYFPTIPQHLGIYRILQPIKRVSSHP